MKTLIDVVGSGYASWVHIETRSYKVPMLFSGLTWLANTIAPRTHTILVNAWIRPEIQLIGTKPILSSIVEIILDGDIRWWGLEVSQWTPSLYMPCPEKLLTRIHIKIHGKHTPCSSKQWSTSFLMNSSSIIAFSMRAILETTPEHPCFSVSQTNLHSNLFEIEALIFSSKNPL